MVAETPVFLLRVLAKAVLNALGAGVLGDVLVEVSDRVMRDWSAEQDEPARRAEVEALSNANPKHVGQTVHKVVTEVAGDQPEATQAQLAAYLTQVPALMRRTLHAKGSTRASLPPSLVLRRGSDLLPFLPPRLPRFRPGDQPLPSVDWVLVELLGVGGFGEVWKARNPRFDGIAPVALKFCLDTTARDRLLRHEAALLNQVMRQGKHPGIVPLLHTYLSADPPCLEYEYVDGGDLAGLIQDWHQQKGGPSTRQAARMVQELAEIMAFVHTLQPPIVHRDLKPANILVQRDAAGKIHLRIADFGIGGIVASQAARLASSTPRLSLATALLGSHTPLYSSPEQMRGAEADPRDDIHALGIIWYQILTGDLGRGAPTGLDWMAALEARGMSQPLIRLMASCFASEAAHRPKQGQVLWEQLLRCLKEEEDLPKLAPETPRPKEHRTAPPTGGNANRSASAKTSDPKSSPKHENDATTVERRTRKTKGKSSNKNFQNARVLAGLAGAGGALMIVLVLFVAKTRSEPREATPLRQGKEQSTLSVQMSNQGASTRSASDLEASNPVQQSNQDHGVGMAIPPATSPSANPTSSSANRSAWPAAAAWRWEDFQRASAARETARMVEAVRHLGQRAPGNDDDGKLLRQIVGLSRNTSATNHTTVPNFTPGGAMYDSEANQFVERVLRALAVALHTNGSPTSLATMHEMLEGKLVEANEREAARYFVLPFVVGRTSVPVAVLFSLLAANTNNVAMGATIPNHQEQIRKYASSNARLALTEHALTNENSTEAIAKIMPIVNQPLPINLAAQKQLYLSGKLSALQEQALRRYFQGHARLLLDQRLAVPNDRSGCIALWQQGATLLQASADWASTLEMNQGMAAPTVGPFFSPGTTYTPLDEWKMPAVPDSSTLANLLWNEDFASAVAARWGGKDENTRELFDLLATLPVPAARSKLRQVLQRGNLASLFANDMSGLTNEVAVPGSPMATPGLGPSGAAFPPGGFDLGAQATQRSFAATARWGDPALLFLFKELSRDDRPPVKAKRNAFPKNSNPFGQVTIPRPAKADPREPRYQNQDFTLHLLQALLTHYHGAALDRAKRNAVQTIEAGFEFHDQENQTAHYHAMARDEKNAVNLAITYVRWEDKQVFSKVHRHYLTALDGKSHQGENLRWLEGAVQTTPAGSRRAVDVIFRAPNASLDFTANRADLLTVELLILETNLP